MFSSEFCSGNLTRAQRGYLKNNFDIWVASDASPHMEGEYYRTWFYFSVTGVPQGELITFTFKNLSNQVSITQATVTNTAAESEQPFLNLFGS